MKKKIYIPIICGIIIGIVLGVLLPAGVQVGMSKRLLSISMGELVYANPDALTNSPSSNTGAAWTNPTNAYADGGGAATQTSGNGANTYAGYGFSLTGDKITQVRVRTDAWCTGIAGVTNSKNPTANTNGTYPWTSPANAYSSDGSYATCVFPQVTWRASGSPSRGASPQTIGLPSGMSANDVVIMIASTATGGAITITANGSIATWNAMTGSPMDSGGEEKLYVWWGVYSSGSTGASLSSTGDHIVGQTIAYYNVNTTSPINVSATGFEAASDTNLSFATGLTTTSNNEVVIIAASTGADANSAAQFSAWADGNLSSIAERMNYCSNTGGGGGAGAAQGTLATAGAVGTWTATYATASKKDYISFALKPTAVTTQDFDQIYNTFGFTDVGGTVTAVEIGYEAFATATQKLDFYTSANGGGSWSSVHTTNNLAASDPNSYTYVDVTSDQTWTWTLLNNSNFKIKLVSNWQNGAPTFYVDALVVRVTYTTATNEQIRVAVTWNGGSDWSSNYDTNLNGSEQTLWADVTGATAWTPTKLANGNFQVRVSSVTVGDTSTVSLDWMPTEVTYIVPSITIPAPTSKDFGSVAESSSYWTNGGGNPFPDLTDPECYFTVTNNSGGGAAVNISVHGHDFTGSGNWALVSGVPGLNEVRVKAGKSGDALETDMVTLGYTDQDFILALADATSKKFELKMETGTFGEGSVKTGIVTLSAVCVP